MSFFREEKCNRCGECFTRCQYLDLGRAEAVREIEGLIAGKPGGKVLGGCVSCYACDAFCPYDARPYALILESWDRRYRERGLPVRASYLLPYHEPNYRSDMEARMNPRERELLARWKSAPVAGEVLYPGCNLLTAPYLFDLRVLDRLPVAGDWSLCCGEPFYRMGLFEVMEKIAAHLTAYYADKKIQKMVFACPACLNMFRTVLPRDFGARLDFECEYIVTWLLREMDAGRLTVTHPLNRTVTVHDSCHGRVMGAEIMDPTRELYRRLGLKVLEMKRHHENGLCCGIAAGCSNYMPHTILGAARRELREGAVTGVGEMAIYCTGCYLMLNIADHLVRTGQDLTHTLELVGEAVGEKLPRTVSGRTFSILANITKKAIPLMVSRKRYKVEKLETEKKN
jgi:Fe-S oxidoreductase